MLPARVPRRIIWLSKHSPTLRSQLRFKAGFSTAGLPKRVRSSGVQLASALVRVMDDSHQKQLCRRYVPQTAWTRWAWCTIAHRSTAYTLVYLCSLCIESALQRMHYVGVDRDTGTDTYAKARGRWALNEAPAEPPLCSVATLAQESFASLARAYPANTSCERSQLTAAQLAHGREQLSFGGAA